jgi:pimeloyl-ACP methyl ester carboxylesterase
MLALASAAAHPETVLSLVLIGCGTFDEISRKLYKDRVESLFDADLRSKIAELEAEQLDPDEALRRKAAIALSAWSHDLITTDFEYTGFDAIGHQETWNDMVRLQVAGVYPQSFVDIMSPVLMLHGSLDPHPGAATRDCLGPYLRRLEYHEWADCGHYPWHERSTRRDFYERLLAWLDVGWQSAHVS